MKVIKLLGKVLLGLLVGAVSLFVLAFAINWNDRPPSADARRLVRLIADRPQVRDADNAYVYLLGFSGPADQDPAEVGARRRAWLEAILPESYDPDGDPLQAPLSFREAGDSVLGPLKKACLEEARQTCAATFEALAGTFRPTPLDALALARYEQLLARRTFREVVPPDLRAPLPAYGDVMYAQRIALLQQMQHAKAGRLDEVARFLRADHEFWRATQRAANCLISKLIAVAALRNHFYFSNLILRQAPPGAQMALVPDGWSREFSAEERSMLPVMAGELMFVDNTFLHMQRGDVGAAGDDLFEIPSAGNAWQRAWIDLEMHFFQRQAEVNFYAERYARLSDAFDVPIGRYAQVTAELKEFSPPASGGWHIYNPVGRYLREKYDGTSYLSYPPRVASLEGMRRAALLTAQLRSRAIRVQDVAEELQHSGQRNPYTGEAFEWDAGLNAVVFDGQEDHRWHRNEYPY